MERYLMSLTLGRTVNNFGSTNSLTDVSLGLLWHIDRESFMYSLSR
ncbi:MAG: hypothetical protein ACLU4J_15720 [Butyricimonas paravirosa]